MGPRSNVSRRSDTCADRAVRGSATGRPAPATPPTRRTPPMRGSLDRHRLAAAPLNSTRYAEPVTPRAHRRGAHCQGEAFGKLEVFALLRVRTARRALLRSPPVRFRGDVGEVRRILPGWLSGVSLREFSNPTSPRNASGSLHGKSPRYPANWVRPGLVWRRRSVRRRRNSAGPGPW